jgi:hypothetical protein
MSMYDADDTDDDVVLGRLRDSLGVISMNAPIERIEAAGHTRRRHRRLAATSMGLAAVSVLSLGAYTVSHPATAPPAVAAGGVHIHLAAYSVDTQTDGSILVQWDKAKYFSDSEGLQAALTRAGFPVLMKTGEFCKGPQDDGYLNPSGIGRGVSAVMKGTSTKDGNVTFTFTPAAMPAGHELFIGYLNADQLAVTRGRPGSVERIVPTGVPLTCTTVAPPPESHGDAAPEDRG